ncbi:phosphatidylglycerol lysyltransferase domain-containing protein [Octadecabacter sp. G9-8]|uniref:Phosphatidylglycerol lysyltransferase domain-containing protein n=1 Tax=Octadecabacter dasysiphoniae TaxID=2909341 RepID=A0ABS9CZL7_9RHOB|nr:phosphatidylglycerol lysyltransferase domain-containing protein [Octadecabacter dasysiphoniae]MCF2872693.1 phosphatidylglycerol lysyltransferase domain-containing protein [Octadecabacter dasysiphoniae]
MKTQIGVAPLAEWRTFFRKGRLLQLVPLVALGVFGTLFIRHIAALDGVAVVAALTALAPWQWMCALVFTALSFRTIGEYDVLMHRVLNTGQPVHAARAAGVKAIALSQTLGFGAITSALVRWRCLPDLPPAHILKLSAAVSLSFLAALAAITALVVPLSGLMPRSGGHVAIGIAAIAALALLARLAQRSGWIPIGLGRRTIIALIVATAADTLFAALALWVLWPEPVSFHVLFAAYLIALGAGLVSNAPGGVGAFDLSLLALLGATQNADAMAAILAFRIIYYALPAGIAILGLLHSRVPLPVDQPHHPEATLLRQHATRFVHVKGTLLTLPCWGGDAVLGDLPRGMQVADLRRSTDPKTLYKCSARQASQARAAGWSVMRCAQDAWISPKTWSSTGPARRQLRRALCAFERSGFSVREVSTSDGLCAVAQDWAKSHGGERGHSMGRYCPDYVRHQRVFAAFDGDTPVAFVSFHIGPVWTLDLMRHVSDIPKGTMHALVCAGIKAAQNSDICYLSLASVAAPDPHAPFARTMTEYAAGLRRFKSAFAPIWEPRYICSSGRLGLLLAMTTLAIRIRWPAPLANPNPAQRHHEDFSFAHRPRPCEPLTSPIGETPHDQRPFRTARHA